MRTKQRNFAIAIIGFIMAIAMVLGFTALGNKPIVASAAGNAPVVKMVNGAQARYSVNDPGIKFTAEIENYDSSYTYGMLILPEKAFTTLAGENFIGRYHAYFNEKGITNYADQKCGVYNQKANDGSNPRISLALTHIRDYAMGFVGVAYAEKNGAYIYADVNMVDNARSIAYVAQVALKNEADLDDEKIAALKEFANGNYIFESDSLLNDNNLTNSGTVIPADYAMKYIFNISGEEVSQVTKNAYAGGSTVSFKYYIPEGASAQWWGLAWSTTNTGLDIYAAAANTSACPLSKNLGAWTDVSFTLPSGGPYYLYFGSEVGHWKFDDGSDAYVLIDDFTVGSTTETFTSNLADSIFNVNISAAVTTEKLTDTTHVFENVGIEQQLGAKITVDLISTTASTPSFITKQAYTLTQDTVVTFDYYMTGNTNSKWWTLAWTNNNTVASIYCHVENNKANNDARDLPTNVQDSWATASVTVPAGTWYFYFAGAVGEWSSGSVTIDNFKIGDIVTETFNSTGNANDETDYGIFVDNRSSKPDAITLVDGKQLVTGEHAAELDPDSDVQEYVLLTTKNAYAGGSVVSFKYYLNGTPADENWWGIAWNTDASKANIYHAAGIEANYVGHHSIGKVVGEWTTVEFTLPEGGDYYLYFGHCVGGWNGTILIDNFTVNGELVEDFNGEPEEWMFDIGNPSYVSYGEGYVEKELEEIGEVAMRIYFNNGNDGVRARTTDAYAGGSTVEFKYYIQADTATQWTRFIWDTDTSGDNYADTYTSFGNTAGSWVEWSYTLPSGGPYYLYFGFECGNWKDSSGAPYILIDDFTVNGEVETFNYGVENSTWTILQSNLAGNSEIGEGYTPPAPGVYGAKLTIDLISTTASTPSFITEKAYTLTQDTIVTFDYYMTGNTNSKWWTLAWTNNNTVASIYCHVENNKANNDARDLPTNVQDSWATASVTVPAGTWYFYFAGAVGEWSSGSVTIDNFKVGEVVFEDFNSGLGIFLDNRSSKPDAIVLAEGKEEFVPGEHAAKFDFSTSFDCVSTTFMTKEAVAKGGDTVTLQYYIPEESTVGSWWFLGWSTTKDGASFWVPNQVKTVNGGLGLGTTKGQWVTATVDIPTDSEGYTYYLYVCGYENWSGPVYIDNVVVTRGENVIAEEDFNGDPEEWMFDIGNSSYVSYGEGYDAPEAPEAPEEPQEPTNPDPNVLENLIYNGTVVDFLEAGELGAIVNTNASIDSTDIPETMLIIEGGFYYALAGEKEFAIYFGNGQYVFIDKDSIAFYVGTELIREFAVEDAENEVFLAITAGGRLSIGLDGAFYSFGNLSSVTNVKLVALGGSGQASFKRFNIITYKCILSDIPYFEDGTIDFSAYAFDSEAMVSDAGFQLLSEAGFTKTLPLLQGRVSGLQGMYGDSNYSGSSVYNSYPTDDEVVRLMAEVNADAHKALDLAQKYGMQHYVFNEVLYNLSRHDRWYADGWLNKVANASTYLDHPALAGHVFVDEPSRGTELDNTITAYNKYVEAYGRTDAYTNLLPLTSTVSLADTYYNSYVDSYVSGIALGANGSGFISYDQYPLKTSGIDGAHLRNFEIVAEKCRDNSLEFRYLLKASVTGDADRSLRATQSVNDLYMQIYSALCFGVEEIGYYQFTDHTATDGSAGDAVISGYSLEKTDVYNWAKQANNEVHAFEDAYMSYAWKSVSLFGSTSLTQFSKIKNEVAAYGYISSVSSSASVLVGNFDDADGKYTYGAKHAYMVMNYGNTNGATTATTAVTLTFNGTPTRVLVYQGGVPTVVNLTSNQLTLNLMIGEGAFVIPLTTIK